MESIPRDVVVRRLYAALDGRDTTALTALFDEASVLHLAGASGLAGDYQGAEAIAGLLRLMADLTGGSLHYGAAQSANDRHGRVVFQGRAIAERRGRRLITAVRIVATVEGGVVSEATVSYEDQPLADAFWS